MYKNLITLKRNSKMSINVKKQEDSQNIGVHVYDISLDGSVVIANGGVIASNTDG